jgi:hypothetical protein
MESSVNNAEIKSRPNNTPSTIANTLIIESSVNNAEIKSRPNNTPSTIANILIMESSVNNAKINKIIWNISLNGTMNEHIFKRYIERILH